MALIHDECGGRERYERRVPGKLAIVEHGAGDDMMKMVD